MLLRWELRHLLCGEVMVFLGCRFGILLHTCTRCIGRFCFPASHRSSKSNRKPRPKLHFTLPRPSSTTSFTTLYLDTFNTGIRLIANVLVFEWVDFRCYSQLVPVVLLFLCIFVGWTGMVWLALHGIYPYHHYFFPSLRLLLSSV
jgi:hypothetical protein